MLDYFLQLFLFTSYIPEHRCRVPICDLNTNATTSTAAVETDFLEFAVPSKHNAKGGLNGRVKDLVPQGKASSLIFRVTQGTSIVNQLAG